MQALEAHRRLRFGPAPQSAWISVTCPTSVVCTCACAEQQQQRGGSEHLADACSAVPAWLAAIHPLKHRRQFCPHATGPGGARCARFHAFGVLVTEGELIGTVGAALSEASSFPQTTSATCTAASGPWPASTEQQSSAKASQTAAAAPC
eukprot:scaffold53604_cov69-Phaeocystis_antarctica.AAC.2